jgi:hypothetical protein
MLVLKATIIYYKRLFLEPEKLCYTFMCMYFATLNICSFSSIVLTLPISVQALYLALLLLNPSVNLHSITPSCQTVRKVAKIYFKTSLLASLTYLKMQTKPLLINVSLQILVRFLNYFATYECIQVYHMCSQEIHSLSDDLVYTELRCLF